MDIKTVASDVGKVMRDLNFPAHKQQVVEHAKQQGASGQTIQTLLQLPDQNFGSVEELTHKLPIGDIESAIQKFL